jgi:hypothetical protein
MGKLRAIVGICAAWTVTGCAAIFDGTSQQISVNTNPAEARCKLVRLGAPIGEISSTPGAVTVQKTKNDITIVCAKPGYTDATYLNKSGIAGATFANILGGVVTGGIAWAIDSSSGADNKYDSQVNMTLIPTSMVPPTTTDPPAPLTTETPGVKPTN